MPGLSDEELRKRLEAHKYPVPPITATTRVLLQRKLDQLDGDNQKSSRGKNLCNYVEREIPSNGEDRKNPS